MNSNGIAPKQSNTISVRVLQILSSAKQETVWYFSISIFVISFLLSIYFDNSNFFSASGGLVTIVGLLILASISIPVNEKEIEIEYRKAVGQPFAVNDDYWRTHHAESHNRFIKEKNGHIFAINVSIVGTVVWAYGWVIDYLPFMGSSTCT